MNGVELNTLAISRGAFELRDITFDVPMSSTAFLMGPNGAGKSSLLFALLGFLRPVAGHIRVLGEVPHVRSRRFARAVGFVPDSHDDVIEELTGEEFLNLHRRLRASGRDERRRWEADADALAASLDLTALPSRIASYSHGMRKKVQLVAALQSAPELLVLDEPFNGLDLASQQAVEGIVRGHAAAGGVVVGAVHSVEHAERCADQVLVVSRGSVCAVDPGAVRSRLNGGGAS